MSARLGLFVSLLFLAPGFSHGLEDLLLDWGVLVDDDLVFDTGPANVSDSGDLVILAFDKTHPVTQTLISYNFKLLSAAPAPSGPTPAPCMSCRPCVE